MSEPTRIYEHEAFASTRERDDWIKRILRDGETEGLSHYRISRRDDGTRLIELWASCPKDMGAPRFAKPKPMSPEERTTAGLREPVVQGKGA